MRGFSVLVTVAVVTTWTRAFNVDKKHPVVFRDEFGGRSYFGFSVGLLTNNAGSWVLVGAPRANSSRDTRIVEPGVIYSCSVEKPTQCVEIALPKSMNPVDHQETLGYVEKRDNAWLGVSLDVGEDSKPNVVACGHLWKNQIQPYHWTPNGICYTIDTQLNMNTARGLLPLINRYKQSDGDRAYIYGLGMAGISSHFIQNTDDLVLGAPGVDNLKGTIVYTRESEYSRHRYRQKFHIPVLSAEQPDDTYIGYSVSSGSFFNSKDIQLVTGAPRDGISGSVHIVQIPIGNEPEFASLLKLEGQQMGEYFGSCVCAVDFNGDKLTDLLVGAPLHSVHQDEGKVYVYAGSAKGGLVRSEEHLFGSTVVDARFGSAISNVGDLDRDGFQDVAIGAPYEGAGAVYLYRGSSKGLTLSQKFLASEINGNLRGFGISISKGKDVDRNSYSDLAVGAYESGHAVLLKSFPVISLQATLDFNISQINLANSSCEHEDQITTCFSVMACVSYTGLDGPNHIDVTNTLTIGTRVQNETRSFLVSGGDAVKSIREDATLVKNSPTCKSYDVHVPNSTFDILTPVSFYLKSEILNNPQTEGSFCKDCPVPKPGANGTITASLPFVTNCGDDNVCNADLGVQARAEGFSSDVAFILGISKVINLTIDVTNGGAEPAYLARASILLSSEITFSRLDKRCHGLENEREISCDLGNPLNPGDSVVLKLAVDVSELKLPLEFIQFMVNVTTTSNDGNVDNDVADLIIPVRSDADVTVFGSTINEQIRLTKDEPENENASTSVVIRHTFQVWNEGRSPIHSVTLATSIPKISFISILSAEPRMDGKPSTLGGCTIDPMGENPNEETLWSFSYSENYVSIDCKTVPCVKFTCPFGPFVNGEVATLIVSMEVLYSGLRPIIKDKDSIRLVTRGHVTINDLGAKQPANHKPDETEVITQFIKEGAPQPKKLADWVIPLCILAGILLLLLLILLLYKLGFFRRKEKEEMAKLADNSDTDDALLNRSGKESNSDKET